MSNKSQNFKFAETGNTDGFYGVGFEWLKKFGFGDEDETVVDSEDHNRGHGNDDDRHDDNNPGNHYGWKVASTSTETKIVDTNVSHSDPITDYVDTEVMGVNEDGENTVSVVRTYTTSTIETTTTTSVVVTTTTYRNGKTETSESAPTTTTSSETITSSYEEVLSVEVVDQPTLFTEGSDSLNFNAIVGIEETMEVAEENGNDGFHDALDGNDIIWLPKDFQTAEALEYDNTLTFNGMGGDDTIYAGDNLSAIINGGEGNDTLFGGSENDTLIAEAGNDYLNGGYGNDTLIGGEGNDRLYGGDDNDTLIVQGGGDDKALSGYGNDTIEYHATAESTLVVNGSKGDDTLSVYINPELSDDDLGIILGQLAGMIEGNDSNMYNSRGTYQTADAIGLTAKNVETIEAYVGDEYVGNTADEMESYTTTMNSEYDVLVDLI